jgi:PBP1b-binding outer membrane lipoprotein LpoB
MLVKSEGEMIKRYLLIVMTVFVLTGCLNNTNIKDEVKTETLQYLKDKYKKEFVILKSKKNIETGLYTLHAAPQSNAEEQFSVYTYEKNVNTGIII